MLFEFLAVLCFVLRVAYAELACAVFLRGGAQTPFKVGYLKVCALLFNVVFAVGTQQGMQQKTNKRQQRRLKMPL